MAPNGNEMLENLCHNNQNYIYTNISKQFV
jgi:hypothetical protein